MQESAGGIVAPPGAYRFPDDARREQCVLEPTAERLKMLLSKGSRPTIVMVGGDACFPCQKLRPFLRKFAFDHDGAIFVAIRAHEHRAFAEEWGVDAVPQMLVFRDGALSARSIGFEDYQSTRREIAALLDVAAPTTESLAEAAFAGAVAVAEAALDGDVRVSSDTFVEIWEPLRPAFEAFEAEQGAAHAAGVIDAAARDVLVRGERARLLAPHRARLDNAFRVQSEAAERYAARIERAVDAYLAAS